MLLAVSVVNQGLAWLCGCTLDYKWHVSLSCIAVSLLGKAGTAPRPVKTGGKM